jgi:VIT1/CCC1 family predicted Fe2+/Mn2+ transporter
VLEPIDRVSEILFGVIMALTFTCTLGVATAGANDVRTMLFGALGCNLAWGIIDAGVFLVARLNERGAKLRILRTIRNAAEPAKAHRVIAEHLPEEVAELLPPDQLEGLRRKLQQMPEPAAAPGLNKHDGLAALSICALSFLSTFPIVIPFIFIGDAWLALRVSNAVAIVMLFLCGYALGRYSGIPPWLAGAAMVVFGAVMVGVAILLGG